MGCCKHGNKRLCSVKAGNFLVSSETISLSRMNVPLE
jgi:hypothetical protein